VYEDEWLDIEVDFNRLELNLVFKTKEEAEARRKEIVEFLKGEQ
jgi:hypothetical protein